MHDHVCGYQANANRYHIFFLLFCNILCIKRISNFVELQTKQSALVSVSSELYIITLCVTNPCCEGTNFTENINLKLKKKLMHIKSFYFIR